MRGTQGNMRPNKRVDTRKQGSLQIPTTLALEAASLRWLSSIISPRWSDQTAIVVMNNLLGPAVDCRIRDSHAEITRPPSWRWFNLGVGFMPV
ncbi:MAG TPA: hypothetical protein DCE41_37720 [Cytophagales bacterium]|nr:hypothetical protein [Cytophagales bacterium]